MTAARFTLMMTIQDGRREQEPVRMAIGIDEAMRISSRLVDDIKAGPSLGVALVDTNTVVRVMKERQLRRDVLKQLAIQLAGQLADRLEDAEGWHDASRIEPARAALGGDWR